MLDVSQTARRDFNMNKDKAIVEVLDRLRNDLGSNALTIKDHWDADLCAIGVTRPDNDALLCYISTFRQPVGSYYLELERTDAESLDGSATVCHESVDYEALRAFVADHLGCSEVA